MRLDVMINRFIADVCAGKTNETPNAYRSKLNHLEKYFGADRENINQEEVDAFKKHLLERETIIRGGKEIKGNLSKFTIRSILSTTRHFLHWAGDQGYIPKGITLRNIHEPKPDPKAVDQETIQKLLAAVEHTGPAWEQARNRALLYVLIDTEGRVGSICAIEQETMNLTDGYAIVKDKGDQLSWLWFEPQTIDAIREWQKLRIELKPKDYKLFTGSRGTGLTREGVYRVLARLAQVGKVTGRFNPHSFRHAFAREMILAGADLGVVSDLMNHASIVTTYKYYARWKKKELKHFHTRYSPGKKLPPVGQGSAKP